jgi:HAD superfamily hydrolase (TIGR01490 family)
MNDALSFNPQAGKSIAAFFDLDGTLLPPPSLERRFATMLRYRRAIPAGNYLRWLAQTVRLAPSGIARTLHTNKMYLHNISVVGSTGTLACPEERRASARVDQETYSRTPAFFPAALDRVVWHATQGHAIVLVTGTLASLASEAALALVLRLIARGITTSVAVSATQLEQANGRWTGRIVGDAMFAEGKASAVQRIASTKGFDLIHSYAYGDSEYDRWMLGAVGRPSAVNPSRELERIAKLRNWPILRWNDNDGGNVTARATEDKFLGGDRNIMPYIKSETLG